MTRTLLPTLLSLAALLGCLHPLAAQCTTAWTAGVPQPELSGLGRCTTFWDPDGAGPTPSRLVVGGDALIGDTVTNAKVMLFDGTRWLELSPGLGTTGTVRKLVVWNGLLVAGGSFAGNVAAWNGAAWLPLGPGVPFPVEALTVWNGNLVAAGTVAGGGTTPCAVQVWNGVAWTSLPSPPQLANPRDAVAFQGQLCLAGSRLSIGFPIGCFERWNGTAWAPTVTANGLSGLQSLSVRGSLAVGGTEVLYAGGSFNTIGGTAANNIASTTGGTAFTWSAVAGGLPAGVLAVHARPAGLSNFTVVAVTSGATPQEWRLNGPGGAWTAMGTSPGTAITFLGGTYFLANEFAGAAAALSWSGTAWEPVRGAGFVGEVRALAADGAQTIVGGVFAAIAGATMNHIARWDGTTFTPLGGGMTGSSVDALLRLGNGDVVAGGAFTAAGGTAANNLARWNGNAWSAFGSGLDQRVLAIARMPNGDLVVGGTFATAGGVPCARIARWNGSAWSPLGSGMNGDVGALAVRDDGVLFAAGSFTTAGGLAAARIAQWNGTGWLPLGAGCNGTVHALATRPNGDIVAVGAFTSAGGFSADRCARWIGTGWAPMGAASGDTTPARAVHVLPNGDVIAGRGFHQPGGSTDAGIARWNGSTWSGVAVGLTPLQPSGHVDVRAFTMLANGALVVGGDFSAAGALVARDFAVLSTTCPATAQAYGSGCSSAAGPLVLTADALPWIAAPFRTTTTGVAPGSLCIGLVGFATTSIPLQSLLPEGQPGCSLLASPDLTFLLANGTATTASSSLALANAPALIGAQFFQQTVPLEFNAVGAIAAVRSSNALALVCGSF